MNDKQIVQALIERDELITEQFFFKDCKPMFISVIKQVFTYEVNYDEFVNEFYLHLMENDAYRFRQFQGRSTVFQWMKIVAIHYFWAKKSRMIDMKSSEPHLLKPENEDSIDSSKHTISKMDVHALLSQMTNQRQAYVIRRMVLEDIEPEKVAKELNVTVDNLYNIKKRALAALTRIVSRELK